MRHFIPFFAALICFSCGQNSSKEKKQMQPQDSVKMVPDSTGKTTQDSTKSSMMTSEQDSLNKILLAGTNGKWHLITEEEAKKDKYYEELHTGGPGKEELRPPLVIKGDFDGDNKMDYAALVATGGIEYEQLETRIAIIPAGGAIALIEESNRLTTVLKTIPKGTTISDSDNIHKMKLKSDAIDINNGDAGGYYLVWNGKKYEVVFEEG